MTKEQMKKLFAQYFDMESVPENKEVFKNNLSSESLLIEFQELVDKMYEDECSQHELETRLQGLRWGLKLVKDRTDADDKFLNTLHQFESTIYNQANNKLATTTDTHEDLDSQNTVEISI